MVPSAVTSEAEIVAAAVVLADIAAAGMLLDNHYWRGEIAGTGETEPSTGVLIVGTVTEAWPGSGWQRERQ